MNKKLLIFGFVFLFVVTFVSAIGYNSGENPVGYNIIDLENLLAKEVYSDNQVAQYHREAGIDTNTINEWKNISFDTIVEKETTKGYSLADNNESIQVDFDGIVKAQGKVTIINNASSTETQKIAFRIVSNQEENRCTQVSSDTQRSKQSFKTIVMTGMTRVKKGDKLQLQYQVDDTDLDIWGDPVFEQPVAVSLNFEKVD